MIAHGKAPQNANAMQLCNFEKDSDAFYSLGCLPDRASTNQACAEENLCEHAHVCVFDTETSGLSKKDCAIQMALGFYDENGAPLGFYDRLWQLPDGMQVSQGSFRIHNISTERLQKEGYQTAPEIRRVMKYMLRMRERGKVIVAHNATFDCRMLAQTAERNGENCNIFDKHVFCTMKASKLHCGLKSLKTGRAKAPSNSELYEILTGGPAVGELHNALFDLKVTSTSYFQGAKRGWW